MKKETETNKDQAEELRHLVEEIEDYTDVEDTAAALEETIDKREIDVLNLPPRREVHIAKERTRLRFSKPFIRITVVVIILIAVLLCTYYLI